jgi:hypothetical protein
MPAMPTIEWKHYIRGCMPLPGASATAALLLQRCATAGDSCNDILMLDGKMPAIVVSGCTGSKHERHDRTM